MPQTSSVCSRASASKGQLRSTTLPPVRCGSYPFSVKAWQVQARSRSGLGRGPADARAWSATLRAPTAPGGSQGLGGVVPCAAASSMAVASSCPGEVVSAFRQDHRELSAGSCVQLGGTAGAGASTLGEPLEADVEQAFLGKLVEVELRSMTSDAEGVGGLVSTDWRGLGAHVQVEVAPDRVGERRHAGHTRRKIVSGHECRLF